MLHGPRGLGLEADGVNGTDGSEVRLASIFDGRGDQVTKRIVGSIRTYRGNLATATAQC